MTLSGTGIWSAGLRFQEGGAEAAAELEELGYTSVWLPAHHSGGFAAVEQLLSATTTLTVGTGILSVWTYGPEETARAHAELTDRYGPRFLLGLGVSHESVVASAGRDLHYARPLQRMREFLDALDAAPRPVPREARVLAALGPKMLELSARCAGGAHPYNVTPEHTARARKALGPDKLLAPEQAVVLTTDRDEGRRLGREFLEHYLDKPNYTDNLRRLGFDEDDLAGGGSDRLVDAMVAWGDEEAIAARVREHRDAGADTVCIQVVNDGMAGMPRAEWRALAPALNSLG